VLFVPYQQYLLLLLPNPELTEQYFEDMLFSVEIFRAA